MRSQRVLPTLVLVLLLAVASWAAPSTQAQNSAELFKNLMTLVSTEFIDAVPPAKLVNGAFEGLNEALKAKKLPPAEFTKVPESATRDDAMKAFTAQYYSLAAKHPELAKDDQLAFAAIKGMLKDLGDQYTVFLDPEEYGHLKDSMSGGNFGGLGIYIELDKNNDGMLTVVEPIEDTPASKAGLKPRDVLVKIDGKSTRNITIEQAQTMLRGPIGSKVVLTVRRLKQASLFDVTLARDKIHVNSVNHKLIERDGKKIGYMRLRMFGDATNDEMERAMRDLEKKGAEAFILDLRNNGGGYIQASVDVCSKFLPTGSQVVSVAERGEPVMPYTSHPNLRTQMPLVLLVNEYSASASEITAGAMKDLNRARLVGVKTFGKGSVQKIFPLPNGSALKVTTAHYHTPSGKDINKLGIEPDVKVEMPAQKLGATDDAQYEAAVTQVVGELNARVSPVPRADDSIRIASVDEELKFLRSQEELGFSVESRKMVRDNDRLVEEIVLRKGAEQKTVRLDLSGFLSR